MSNNTNQAEIEERFLRELRHHLEGLKFKASRDFGVEAFQDELTKLQGDSIYPQFSFDTLEYVLIRLMGRVSISIGRRLGEIYDKIPRFVAAARFGLTAIDVAPVINGLALDIGLQYPLLSRMEDINHIKHILNSYFKSEGLSQGVGIEIRYNFNPNDSARLRKDENMAEYLQSKDLTPVYLVFSSISPRQEAIERLRRAGWQFLIGNEAVRFASELLGLNLAHILEQPNIKTEIKHEIDELMKIIYSSPILQAIAQKYSGTIET